MVFPVEVWGLITHLGDFRLWLALFLIIAIWAKFAPTRKKRIDRVHLLLLLLLSFAITGVITEGVKLTTNIPRPCDPLTNPYCPTGPSFPSGHAALSFAMFTAMWFWRCSDKRWALIFAFPILISLSRLALGVHTFVDVAAGAALGASITAILWLWLKRIKKF